MDGVFGPPVGHHRVAMITTRRVVITALLTFAVGLLFWVARFTDDNEEQGVPIWLCRGLKESWHTLWPNLRHL